MHSSLVVTTFTLAALANAASHQVLVGDKGLVYSPNTLTAAMGDTVEFSFVRFPHNVVHGSFANPCQPSGATAFYSGDINKANQTFTITVTSTDPIYYYCSIPGHCQAGMVAAINPASGMSVSDFANAAMNVQDSSSPSQVQGGTLNAGTANVTSAATMSATSTVTATRGSSSSHAMTMSGSSGAAMSGSSSSGATGTSSVKASVTAMASSPSPTKGGAERMVEIASLALGLPALVMAFVF